MRCNTDLKKYLLNRRVQLDVSHFHLNLITKKLFNQFMIYGYCVRYADGSCTPDVEVYILIKTMVSYFVEPLAISTA